MLILVVVMIMRAINIIYGRWKFTCSLDGESARLSLSADLVHAVAEQLPKVTLPEGPWLWGSRSWWLRWWGWYWCSWWWGSWTTMTTMMIILTVVMMIITFPVDTRACWSCPSDYTGLERSSADGPAGDREDETFVFCAICLLMIMISLSRCLRIKDFIETESEECLCLGWGRCGPWFCLFWVVNIFAYEDRDSIHSDGDNFVVGEFRWSTWVIM